MNSFSPYIQNPVWLSPFLSFPGTCFHFIIYLAPIGK